MPINEAQYLDLRDILIRLDTKMGDVVSRGQDHETRLRVLETTSSTDRGKLAMITAFGGMLAGWIGSWLSGMLSPHK